MSDMSENWQTVQLLTRLPETVSRSRKRRRLSFRDCAEQIGITHVMLQRLEGGRLPNVKSLQLVLAWLDTLPTAITCPRCGQDLPPDPEPA